ncbi:hypothetical protein, partial [Escherichia coli]|uniref:hypothetical protein n=1 Tax=Escherichia coli TaxID=562 RepID=UPI001BC89E43
HYKYQDLASHSRGFLYLNFTAHLTRTDGEFLLRECAGIIKNDAHRVINASTERGVALHVSQSGAGVEETGRYGLVWKHL